MHHYPMSTLMTAKAPDLVELLQVGYGLDAPPNNAYMNALVKIDNFDAWGGGANSFSVAMAGCTCFCPPDEEESLCVV